MTVATGPRKAFDFEHLAVRDYFLSLVHELADGYDFDVLELEFPDLSLLLRPRRPRRPLPHDDRLHCRRAGSAASESTRGDKAMIRLPTRSIAAADQLDAQR